MQLDDVLNSRRSIRKYKPDPVSDEQIAALLAAARLAPSGLNCQPWRFVVVRDAEKRRQLADTASPFVAEAPVALLCCMDMAAFSSLGIRMQELVAAGALAYGSSERLVSGGLQQAMADESWVRANLAMNTAIAVTHILLKAADLGLGSCWMGMFDEHKVREIAGLDGRYGVAAIVAVGHAAQAPAPRPRLPMEDLLLKTI